MSWLTEIQNQNQEIINPSVQKLNVGDQDYSWLQQTQIQNVEKQNPKPGIVGKSFEWLGDVNKKAIAGIHDPTTQIEKDLMGSKEAITNLAWQA